MDWEISKNTNGLKGEIEVPPDKSISHRAVILGALSNNRCRVSNFLFSDDCIKTLESFRAMGIKIEQEGSNITVFGKGLMGLEAPLDTLYLGNSGTSMRILSGVLAGQSFGTILTGDDSLNSRPMDRVIKPLSKMGAIIKPMEGGSHAPLKIEGKSKPLMPINYKMPMASAQVKSCVLIAGLYAQGVTSVTEPFQSRDHMERMLEYFSANIKRKGLTTGILGLKELVPKDFTIPSDISSAAFFIVGGVLIKGSQIVFRNVGLNPTRAGLINVLKRMGADIKIMNYKDELEPIGDLKVGYSILKGTIIEKHEIPLLIDEIPILSLAAVFASGKTVVKGINELKVKETDRVKSIVSNFKRMGISVEEQGEDLIITGGYKILKSAEFDSFGDHRIAMTMAIASLLTDGECIVKNAGCTDTSYPGFLKQFQKLQ
ncbi:MAG: 3-phosphoshikimate 1-carboxyvinyltransferase [Candidatus Omnitrophota bacterium]